MELFKNQHYCPEFGFQDKMEEVQAHLLKFMSGAVAKMEGVGMEKKAAKRCLAQFKASTNFLNFQVAIITQLLSAKMEWSSHGVVASLDS